MIKCRRKFLNISQQELADKIGLSKSQISKIENKKFTKINIYLLDLLASELNLNRHNLLDWFLEN